MLASKILNTSIARFGYPLTNCQKELINLLSSFAIDPSQQVLIVRGYAGTGKTSLVSTYINTIEELGIRTVLLAPTGRAAKVISQQSRRPAFTIHKKIYRQKKNSDGFGAFELGFNTHRNTIFVIDEASMISAQSGDSILFGSAGLLSDLLKFVFNDRNCRLIIMGDSAQLPPVGHAESPALQITYYQQLNYRVQSIELTTVVRQQKSSGILYNATNLRTILYQDTTTLPKIDVKNFPDVTCINGTELIDSITSSYEKAGIEETIIITRSNKLANRYNEGIRARIMWREEDLEKGDLLMIVKNNYYWCSNNETIDFIANGDIMEIKKRGKSKIIYDFEFTDLDVSFPYYDNAEITVRVIKESLKSEGASLSQTQNKELYSKIQEDFKDLPTKKQQYLAMRENPYLNALQIKYAYAVTCHKAQGGQWKHVYIDQGFFDKDAITKEYLQWLYTALTRATEHVFLVNFPESMIN